MNRLNGYSVIRQIVRHNVQSTNLIKTAPNAKLKPNQLVSLKLFKMKPYPETYTSVVVRNDGSSYRVWGGVEPHNIIAFPMDVSRMTEIDQQRITMMRTGEKIKPTTIIDIDVDDEEVEVVEKIAKSANDKVEKKRPKNIKKNKRARK